MRTKTPDRSKDKTVAEISLELQKLQRQRAIYIKSRIMVSNRLQAIVACTIGYHAGMTDVERGKMMAKAAKLIKDIEKGVAAASFTVQQLVDVHRKGVCAFLAMEASLEDQMIPLAKLLPVSAWVEQPEQRGFGLQSLATLVGETGDLGNYANPAKVWRRMGCAPCSSNGKTQMGKTWRCGKNGKLHADEWTSFGYSPRRRSVAWNWGVHLQQGNGDGPYNQRYYAAKTVYAEKHPDSKKCWRHDHGMLLATKLFLKNLWVEWNKTGLARKGMHPKDALPA